MDDCDPPKIPLSEFVPRESDSWTPTCIALSHEEFVHQSGQRARAWIGSSEPRDLVVSDEGVIFVAKKGST